MLTCCLLRTYSDCNIITLEKETVSSRTLSLRLPNLPHGRVMGARQHLTITQREILGVTQETPSETSQESHSRGRDSLLWELTSSPLKIPLYAERSSWTHVPRRAGDDECARELCALSRRETSANLGTGWANLLLPHYHCELASSGIQGIDERRE